MDGESKLLVPLWRLPTSLIGVCLLRFLSKSCSAVRVLLAHCLAVREVLCSVNNENECANLWTVDSHVGEDAGCVLTLHNGRLAGAELRCHACWRTSHSMQIARMDEHPQVQLNDTVEAQ